MKAGEEMKWIYNKLELSRTYSIMNKQIKTDGLKLRKVVDHPLWCKG